MNSVPTHADRRLIRQPDELRESVGAEETRSVHRETYSLPSLHILNETVPVCTTTDSLARRNNREQVCVDDAISLFDGNRTDVVPVEEQPPTQEI